jgi:4-aminobutyrate aminotransferase-like enzyme
VRDVRSYGLLIGIELETRGLPRRWMRGLLPRLVLLSLLKNQPFPLLAGFCQYEPNVLKLTPPLSITEQEVDQMCAAIEAVLRLPLRKLASSGLAQTLMPSRRSRLVATLGGTHEPV